MSVAFGIQHAKPMRHIFIVALYGSTEFLTSHKWHDFRKNIFEHKMCFGLSLILFFPKTFCILRRNERDRSKICVGLKVKVKVFLVQAPRLCTGRTAHKGSRGIALLFHDQRH